MGHFAVTSSSCDDQLEKSLIAGSVCKNIDDSSDDDIDKLKRLNKMNGVVSEVKSVPASLPPYVPQDKTNLEKYTETFKGDTWMGIQFKAPLKWDKIIQISLLHLVFIYALAVYPLKKLTIWTTLFGKWFSLLFKFMMVTFVWVFNA